ncbi:carbohydrate ABC transporter substrate-binding protein [Clostridium botulinum]|uniref:ABC transporter substrate-binding protein n=1 Tax=unclassified Clostridium TaxID=2614128 RepID=UPI0013F131BA|nr:MULTISPECIES: ABC transporter substrate-binding protein [unclassified Clostridium]NFG42026.1 carbohydrate ABC transporter substrate-binding protein [Clostridium botulinum]
MKLRMKKTLSTVLAASLLLGTVAGCSSNAGNNAKKDGEGKTVKVFQLKVEINDQLNELAKKYEDETGVKVDITSVGGGADYGASLKAEFAKGTEPDIFMIQGAGDYGVWQHKIDELTAEPWVKDAVNGTLDTVTVDGKVYGMPAATEGYGLMYNKDILDKAQIDPDSIDTFDKLKAAFEKLDSMKAELGIDNVVSYTTKETWVTGNHTFNIPLAVQENPTQFVKDYVAGKADFVNNQYFKDWMNLVDLLCKYGGGATLDTIDYSAQVGNFGASHKTAFLHQGNWTSKDLADLNADFPKGFVPLAINNDTKISGSIPVGVPMYWVVNKDSAVNKEAKDFLNWMVTSEAGQTSIVKDMKMIPAFTNFTVEPEDELAKSIVKFNKAGKTIPWAFTNLPDGFTMNNIGPIFSKFARGEIDKTQMIQQLQDASK